MSAIAGIIHFDGRAVDRATIERMQTVLTPYGKDTQHHVHQGSAAFLRTLLRTTPEDSFDRQPLVHRESGTTLLFDGRIDNRDELAQALNLTPAETRFMADSELVLRACLRWDTSAVERLLGDFALAFWQGRRRRLWLARDPMGVRPLFWHQQPGFFAFSTMPKALFAIPSVERALCEERLHDYLCLLPMVGPKSFFKDVFRVERGQYLVLHGGHVQTHRYHTFDPDREIVLDSDDEYVEAMREQLDRAVACRLRAVGPIATHLSSGLDSSTVTAVAAGQLAERNEVLLAYTAAPREGFGGTVPKGYHTDEVPAAQALAARFPNVRHLVYRSDGTSPVDRLDEQTEVLEFPLLNPCNTVWWSAINRLAARSGARVLLTGGVGNLTVSYNGATYLPGLLARRHWRTWWREARAWKQHKPKLSWAHILDHSLSPFLPYSVWRALDHYRGRSRRLTDVYPLSASSMSRFKTARRAREIGWDPHYQPSSNGRRMRIASLTRLDLAEFNAGGNFEGVEHRDPLGDLRLVELSLGVPESQFWRPQQSPRWLLRRLMSTTLPPEILDCRTRGLQAPDWYENLDFHSLARKLDALSDGSDAGRYVDLASLKAAADRRPSEGWNTVRVERTYRLKLLRGLAASAFVCYSQPAGNEPSQRHQH